MRIPITKPAPTKPNKNRIRASCSKFFAKAKPKQRKKTVKDIIKKYSKKTGKTPNRVIFAAYKTYRNIPLEKNLVINDLDISPEIWVEWNDEERTFGDEDLLLLGDTELKITGFNFTTTEDLLDYVYENSDGGQISIYVQKNYLSEISDEVQDVELIWKGIMLKEN